MAAPPSAPVVDRPFVKEWTLDELVPALETGLKDRDYDRGRVLFAAAKCFACHRYNDEGGGLGPDLSGVAGRFQQPRPARVDHRRPARRSATSTSR